MEGLSRSHKEVVRTLPLSSSALSCWRSDEVTTLDKFFPGTEQATCTVALQPEVNGNITRQLEHEHECAGRRGCLSMHSYT